MQRCLTEQRATPPIEDAPRINLLWLLRLRWVAIAGQITIIVAIQLLLGLDLPQAPLWTVIAAEIASNLACDQWARRGRPVAEWLLGALLAADVCFLTALLALTGGTANPFSFLYLIHVALGAVALRPRWAWGIVALAISLYGSLFLIDAGADPASHAHHFRMHLEGMWLAFALAAWFIVYFVQRVSGALSERELELVAARGLSARHERLASLTTLAAGAAHELGSPLATIAIAAKELERQLAQQPSNAMARDDARLIRTQVERCSAILRQLTEGAGDALGEQLRLVTTEDLITTALSDIDGRAAVQIDLTPQVAAQQMVLPLEAAALAVRNLLKNAVDASPRSTVVLRGSNDAGGVCLEIRDQGTGMPAEVLERLGEPFFTTKEAGRGMGLGLFLSGSILARMGARLEVESSPGCGTVATVVFPAAAARRER